MPETMIRKQIYLPRRQNLLLKRLAKARRVSQAEVIRQALDHEVETFAPAVYNAVTAWEEVLSFIEERKKTLSDTGKPVKWNRGELYEEREARWFRDDNGEYRTESEG